MIDLKRVDFPAPLAPISATDSADPTSRLTLRSAVTEPYLTTMLSTVSTRSSRCGLEIGNGAAVPLWLEAVIPAEIGLDHRFILLHLGWDAFRDDAAAIEADHAPNQFLKEDKVVFDDEYGQSSGSALADTAGKIALLLLVKAGCRLVEQQQAGRGGKGTRHLDTPPRAVGKL